MPFKITVKRDEKLPRWWVKCSCGHAQWFYKYSGARREVDFHMADHVEDVMEPCS